MLSMILKMSAVTGVNIVITYMLWIRIKDKKMNAKFRVLLGVIFGGCAVLSTHFGIDYHDMMLNVRDLSPLTAGLFFDPIAGIIAGLIGGIERYIAGTYFGVGSYTRIACSVSTCLSGFLAAFFHIFIFKRKKPSAVYSYFIGSTMEVFHMYVVFITHRDDMDMAFYVVKTCSMPMIIFTGIGLGLISLIIRMMSGEWTGFFRKKNKEEIQVSQRFQFWLFLVTTIMLLFNLIFGFLLQSQMELQSSINTLTLAESNIVKNYDSIGKAGTIDDISFNVGKNGNYEIFDNEGNVTAGCHKGEMISSDILNKMLKTENGKSFNANIFGVESLCLSESLSDGKNLLVWIPVDEVYEDRDQKTYETVMADILLFTVIYVLISMLVQRIVVSNLQLVNDSLNRITNGNLDEEVSVYESSEFASLSDDINHTVTVLKEYIAAAETRIEQELEYAREIQESALPHDFTFPRDDFELYADMDPAREVGGDFYDFFFIDSNRLCLVIADVSGKGIPAALFMMRSKTALRSFAQQGISPGKIFEKTNDALCEGNEASMFVTVWLGILDLETGHMVCANAGHEYPALKREGGDYELYIQKHSAALGVMEGLSFREYELDLSKGDCLMVYTDGIPEAINEQEKAYGTDRLLAVINANRDNPQEHIIKCIRQDIWAFVGTADQFDDVTMLGIKYLGKGTKIV